MVLRGHEDLRMKDVVDWLPGGKIAVDVGDNKPPEIRQAQIGPTGGLRSVPIPKAANKEVDQVGGEPVSLARRLASVDQG